MKDVYQLINIEQRPSKYHKGYYWLAVFQNISTKEIYETSIDPKMKNFNNWQSVIEHCDRGVLISNCEVINVRGKNIISADSKIKIEVLCNRLDMDNILDTWRDSNSTFNKLFG